ncbi:MAG: XdhC family protein, partial [Burkholderiaceae bacterium]|nr:XdhC family protein [Burkholderiaceae bacterium]
EIAAAKAGTIALIMTHSHALDLDLAAAALANPDIAFTGVIGSATKRARFLSRLRAIGLAAERIDALACPIGMPGLGKEPAVIAAGLAVTLLEIRAKQGQTSNSLVQDLKLVSSETKRVRP